MLHSFRPTLLLAALVSSCCFIPTVYARESAAVVSQPQSVSVGTVLDNAISGSKTPAMGALVIRDGRIVDSAVRGVRRADRPGNAQVRDTWVIGSTGKPMTVALIAKLVDKGVLAWDRPLSQMLPEMGDIRTEYRNVTLLELLSHTSGLHENLQDAKALDAFFVDTRPLSVQREALTRLALSEAPLPKAESAYSYSNSGFLIAALIAERATGRSFESLMQREVFKPLRMSSAGFGPPAAAGLRGHRNDKAIIDPPRKSDDGVPMVYSAAGNMHMSLQDWGRFCVDQLAGSRGKGALLTRASYVLMQTARPGSSAGLDWGVQSSIAGRKGPALVHGGSDGNWLAWAVLLQESNAGLLVIANAAGDMGADQTTHAVAGALLPTIGSPK